LHYPYGGNRPIPPLSYCLPNVFNSLILNSGSSRASRGTYGNANRDSGITGSIAKLLSRKPKPRDEDDYEDE